RRPGLHGAGADGGRGTEEGRRRPRAAGSAALTEWQSRPSFLRRAVGTTLAEGTAAWSIMTPGASFLPRCGEALPCVPPSGVGRRGGGGGRWGGGGPRGGPRARAGGGREGAGPRPGGGPPPRPGRGGKGGPPPPAAR